jgi:DNA-binding NarL/FixJ family response regulator
MSDQGNAHSLGLLNVLLIEEDAAQQRIINELIDLANSENEGLVSYELTTAAGVEAARAMLASSELPAPDIILMAVIVDPAMLTEVRHVVGPACAIVMLSAKTDTSLALACMRAGSDAFLCKPITVHLIQHMWQFMPVMRSTQPPLQPRAARVLPLETGSASKPEGARQPSASTFLTATQRPMVVAPGSLQAFCDPGEAQLAQQQRGGERLRDADASVCRQQ